MFGDPNPPQLPAPSGMGVWPMYIIHAPNLGLGIAVLDQEQEQSRLKGSNEVAEREHWRLVRESGGAGARIHGG